MLQDLIASVRAGFSGSGTRGQLVRSGFGTMVVLALGAISSFALNVLLARLLGKDGYGVYAFALSVALFLVVPASYGMPQFLVREVATFRQLDDWPRLRGYLVKADQITMLASMAISGTGIIVLLASDWWETEVRVTLVWALILLPLLALEQMRGAGLRGLSKVIKGQLPGSLFRPGILLLLLAAFTIASDAGITPTSAMALHALAALTAVVGGTLWLIGAAPREAITHGSAYDTKAMLQGALPFLGLQLLHAISDQVDIILLGILVPPGEVGIFRVAIAVAIFVSFFLSAANIVSQPEVARMYAAGRLADVQRLITGQTRVVAMATIPVFLIFASTGSPFLRLVFGSEFAPAYGPLLILMGGQLVNVMMGPVALVLNMTGNERSTVRGYAFSTAWAVVAGFVLIDLWGVIGAAVAHASTVAFWNVYLAMAVRRKVGISSTAWGAQAPRSG